MVHQTLMALTYSYNSGGTSGSSHGHTDLAFPVLVLVGVSVILFIIGAWRTFQKAGRPGWAAIIPFYSTWLLAEMGDRPGWWGLYPLLNWIPFIGWIGSLAAAIFIGIGVAKNFGKSTVFGVIALGIFTPIGLLILGLSDAQYHGPGMAEGSGSASPTPPTSGPTPPTPPTSNPPTPPTNPVPPTTPPVV